MNELFSAYWIDFFEQEGDPIVKLYTIGDYGEIIEV